MSIQALQELRTKLANDAPLQNFFNTQYGKEARFLIGYKSPNAANYPQVCIVLVNSQPVSFPGHQLTVSVIIGVMNADFSGDQAGGVVNSLMATQLLIDCIDSGVIGAHTTYTGKAKIFTDQAAQHPFYEIEIVIPLTWRNH
jgi:hypothetical protein